MKHIIFSDIDGTFYGFDQKVHPQTIKDIAYAQKNGVIFSLCTGNPFLNQSREVAKMTGADYFIGSNGAFIYDLKNNKEIHSELINKEEAQAILDVAIKYNVSANWWDANDLYMFNPIERVMKIIDMVILKSQKFIEADKVTKDIQKIEFYSENEEALEKAYQEVLKDHNIQIAKISNQHFEMTKKGVSKGAGLKHLINHLNISIENTMAIGDSANDWSMLEIAGYSYAMANASKETKARAKYHTSAVEQNGLGEAIQDFVYRNKLDK